ncbi:TetR/AcrR family transcriptional regulator [Streptomyces sp. GESEQ-4]|uniref:TetR/AcrR family transcriptional regulator n=1 Tax=Streptomyces sp. GESEQ-4 TaxID=2812655 RepID=UPI001B3432D2|nr:TetR/AcrR family transcriptional regulator [Streptomyces sp. GESEQ-4]
MPKLWNETIEAHRRDVRDAILDSTAALATEKGPLSLTMSQIAETVGIGRATLYKYFPDVEAILHAWHAREIAGHLAQLTEVRDRTDDPGARFEAVLEAYALITHASHGHHDMELGVFLHQDSGNHLAHAHLHLHHMVQELVTEAARAGDVRDDIPPAELTRYCLSALAAARTLPSEAAVRRLVAVTLAGMRPPQH